MTAAGIPGRRVLVVEDESIVAMLLEDTLAELGYSVAGPVARVDDALALIAAGGIDGAVLDVNLHGEPSYRVADALAERGLRYVFITGYGVQGLDPAYRDRPVVQKPFNAERLGQALATHVFDSGD